MSIKFDPSKLDFTDIKTSLKKYLEESDVFNDHDFEGSGLSTLLDVLAYNTHINAMTANFSTNEAFLDTAQLRGSVVSHAKALNYLPRSMRAASASVRINVLNVTDTSVEYTIPKYTKFTTRIDNVVYTFYLLEEHTLTSSNNFTADVTIYEGKLLNKRFIVDAYNADDYPIYVIPDQNCDTSTLEVLVKDGLNSTESDTYTVPKNVGELASTFNNYFIYESSNGYYEMILGDGIIGKKPPAGSVIDAKYLKTGGELANGAFEFACTDSFSGKALSTTTLVKASGGAQRESVNSIRFNAPKSFSAQNRAVTENDYSIFLQQEVPYIESLNVWGGETHDEPEYGVVFICVKPVGADTLTDSQKENILETVLDNKNIITVTPKFIDPEFQYIEVKMDVRYEPKNTILTKSQLETNIKNTIVQYGEDNLSSFNSVLRKSRLETYIDQSNTAIVSVSSRILLQRRLKPLLGVKARYNLKFTLPIAPVTSADHILTSDAFDYQQNGITYPCYVRNKKNSTVLEIYRAGQNGEVIVQDDVGYIDTAKNTVVLLPFTPVGYSNSEDGIRFTAVPADENNIYPQRNLLVAIDSTNTAVSATEDYAG